MSFNFQTLLEDSKNAFEKIGLYAISSNVGAVPLPGAEEEVMDEDAEVEDLMNSGKADFYVVMTMEIGDVAWSDRVLDPQQYADKRAFLEIVPSEREILKERAIEELEDWEEGWD